MKRLKQGFRLFNAEAAFGLKQKPNLLISSKPYYLKPWKIVFQN